MALTLQAEVDLSNEALDRIAVGVFTLAAQTSVQAVAVGRHYYQVRNSLLRSFEWNFASQRATLSQISTLTLATMPTSAWAVDDTITGITSGATAQILTVTSNTEYEIIYLDGTFESSETITNGDVESVYWEGQSVEYEDTDVYWWDDSDAEQSTGTVTVAALVPDFEWSYQYALPSDYLRLISVYEDEKTDYDNERYIIEGSRILTNYDTLNIRYVKSVTDPDEYDALFKELFILNLAMRLIPPLVGTKSSQLTAEIKDELKMAEARARVIHRQETNTTGRNDLNLARYGS